MSWARFLGLSALTIATAVPWFIVLHHLLKGI